MLTRDTGHRDMVFKLNQHISHWRDRELTKDKQRDTTARTIHRTYLTSDMCQTHSSYRAILGKSFVVNFYPDLQCNLNM